MRLAVTGFLSWATLSLLSAGDLNPPAAPGETRAPVEPRIALDDLPTTITESGSYYLTGNFTVNDSAAIVIEASDVTLDLNGFTLRGNGGTVFENDGVRIAETVNRVTVLNGSIIGFGGGGVTAYSPQHCRVVGVTVLDCNSIGIIVGPHSVVEDCRASGGNQSGIVSRNAIITRCTADNNGQAGIGGNSGTVISECSAHQNGGDGISAGNDGVISECVALDNGGNGIDGRERTAVTNCSSNGNTLNGIIVFSDSRVEGCTVNDNEQAGILCDATGNTILSCATSGNLVGIHVNANGHRSRIDSNSATGNGTGILVEDSGNIIIRNTLSDNTTPMFVVQGNTMGTLINAVGISITTENPWVNFMH